MAKSPMNFPPQGATKMMKAGGTSAVKPNNKSMPTTNGRTKAEKAKMRTSAAATINTPRGKR